MKTIELDFDKKDELEALASAIRRAKIKVGKEPINVRVFISHSISDTTYAAYLILLVNYFSHELFTEKKKADIANDYKKFISEVSNKYFKSYNVKKLRNDIAKEFKLVIELKKKKPTDAVFGIWKNKNISLSQLREKAWQRTK